MVWKTCRLSRFKLIQHQERIQVFQLQITYISCCVVLYSKGLAADSNQHAKKLTPFVPMLLRTRAPTPSECSTLKTVFSTLLTFIVLEKVLVTAKSCSYPLTMDQMTMNRWAWQNGLFLYTNSTCSQHPEKQPYLLTSLWNRIDIYPTVGATVKLNLCRPPDQHSVGEEQIQKAYEGVVGLKHRPKSGHLVTC